MFCLFLFFITNRNVQTIVCSERLVSHGSSGVARNGEMGVLEEVGRSMPRASRAGAHVSTLLRGGEGGWGSSPRIFFVLHALRLTLMQSGQYTIEIHNCNTQLQIISQ